MKLTIKRFRVPVITEDREFTEMVNPKSKAKNPRMKTIIKRVTDFLEVDLKEYFVDEEHKELEGIHQLNEIASQVAEFNKLQLNMAKIDNTITTVYKKVVCKPTNTETN